MPESQQTQPETEAQTSSAETREKATNPLEEIGKLLRDEPESKVDDQDESSKSSEDESETTTKSKPKNLNELAETLGVKVADLYALEIPFDVGDDVETKTLGEIKDAFRESDSIEVDRLTWEETKAKGEAKLTRANAELQELVSMLPRSAISPQLLETIGQKRADYMATEERLTLVAIPEWSDAAARTKDRTEMSEYLSQFGFASSYLDNVADHKTLAFIRDAAKRAARLERALDEVKTVRKPGHSPSGKPSATGTTKPAGSARQRSAKTQVAKVAELLRTG